jgi:hypothetical protein
MTLDPSIQEASKLIIKVQRRVLTLQGTTSNLIGARNGQVLFQVRRIHFCASANLLTLRANFNNKDPPKDSVTHRADR